jgi:hypothetical protein
MVHCSALRMHPVPCPHGPQYPKTLARRCLMLHNRLESPTSFRSRQLLASPVYYVTFWYNIHSQMPLACMMPRHHGVKALNTKPSYSSGISRSIAVHVLAMSCPTQLNCTHTLSVLQEIARAVNLPPAFRHLHFGDSKPQHGELEPQEEVGPLLVHPAC